jgi:hypothetical protein
MARRARCAAQSGWPQVSGLKSDSARGTGSAGRARAGVRPQRTCRLAGPAGQRPQQPEHSTCCRPAEALRFERTRIGLQTGRFSWNGRRSARGESGVSPTRRRRTSRLHTQKRLQIQTFSEAADGIRTHDLLHGKQSVCSGSTQISPAKVAVLVCDVVLRFPGFHREFTRV